MIHYEVNLEVEAAIADPFLAWLRAHVEEMLALPGFVDARLARVEQPAAADRVRYCVVYDLASRSALEDYLERHAPAMRAAGIQRFGERFSASRRVMTPIEP